MYKALLQFYLKALAAFAKSGLNNTIDISLLKPEVKEILDLFDSYADTLNMLLIVETFASTQEIREDMIDTLSNLLPTSADVYTVLRSL